MSRPAARHRLAIALLVAGWLVLPAPWARAEELTVSAAISLREAVEAVGRTFTAGHPGVTLRFNLGASGDLQKQIEAGAPVDVFLSAATRQMDELEQRGHLVAGTRRAFARNALVVVRPADGTVALARPADLAGPGVTRVAIGNPRTVPAGQYAQESLQSLGLWEGLRPRTVLAENVRQVLEYVARGEVEAGFVYATDVAAGGPRVRVAFRPGEDTYRPIVYPAAVIATTRHAGPGRALVEHLVAPEGQATLARYGFLPPLPGMR